MKTVPDSLTVNERSLRDQLSDGLLALGYEKDEIFVTPIDPTGQYFYISKSGVLTVGRYTLAQNGLLVPTAFRLGVLNNARRIKR